MNKTQDITWDLPFHTLGVHIMIARRGPKSIDDIKSRSIVDTNTGCWIWQGAKSGPGYGGSSLNGIRMMAHRVSFLLSKGSIPTHLEIDHICNVRLCVNPDHLQLLSHADNCKRRDAKKTHCKQGHPWTEENIYTFINSRTCKICAKDRLKAWYWRNRDKSKAISRNYYNTVTKIRNREFKLINGKRVHIGGNDGSFQVCPPEILNIQPISDVNKAISEL